MPVYNSSYTTRVSVTANDATVVVTAAARVAVDGDIAMFLTGTNQKTSVAGEVTSAGERAIIAQGTNQWLAIASTGIVSGTTGVQFGDFAILTNAGTIMGYFGLGVSMKAGFITNTGTILGGVSMLLAGTITNTGTMMGQTQVETRDTTGTTTITNSGTMERIDSRADNTTITNSGDIFDLYSRESLNLVNTGTIGKLRFDNEASTIVNMGHIGAATVFCSQQNDLYDGRGGTLAGTVFGAGGSDTLLGGAGSDTFDGRFDGPAGADLLSGNGGDDTLWGEVGDTLSGGAGDDTFMLGSPLAEVVEFAGEGRDTVVVGFSYTLEEFFENATATGTTALNLTGNAERNVLRGNVAANVLNGAAGIDTMAGGGGSDTYVVDAAYERTIEKAGEGTDTVLSSISWTLAAEVEVLRLTGTATFGNGNASANTLVGNASANVLRGLGGSDTIDGGAGNDLVAGGLGADRLTGAAGLDSFLFDTAAAAPGNADVITDFLAADDTIRLENVVFTGLPVAGALAAAAFRSGAGVTGAGDANDRMVYDTSTGRLYYDADGVGGVASVLVATLTTRPALASADFLVV